MQPRDHVHEKSTNALQTVFLLGMPNKYLAKPHFQYQLSFPKNFFLMICLVVGYSEEKFSWQHYKEQHISKRNYEITVITL